MMKNFIGTGFLFLFATGVIAQEATVNPKWLHGFWNARWIAHPAAPANCFGVYHFRKTFNLKKKPGTFIINVSADNHYRLFVNGRSVCTGPARSDLANWNFETVDIAPFLRQGDNFLASTVWNFGEYRAYAEISFQTAFIVQGNTAEEEIVNTDKSWKVIEDAAYSPLPVNKAALRAYIVVADGEKVKAGNYVWDFEQNEFDDTNWMNAKQLWYGAKARTFGTDGNWQLVPRSIPLPEEKEQHFASVVRDSTLYIPNAKDKAVLNGPFSFRIAAHTKASILLDQSFLTNAYPQLEVSQGSNASVKLTYAEALIDSNGVKGNRNETEGKHIIGLSDEYICDGGNKRRYSPLHFRTFRYLQLDIETKEEPLTIDDVHSISTGYPFEEKASFNSNDPALKEIWDTGWRTARQCAVDTYFDCPYYEQLQYVGDTRIQAMISLFVSGDDRLMKKAINDIAHSFIPDGLTQSRYPSRDLQVIPTFSLWWVCMIHDYWMHRSDDAFVRSHLNGIESVLRWYEDHLDRNGMLGRLSWWQFVDWSWPWVDSIATGGVPPGVSAGGSSIISLQFAYTLQRAAELMFQYDRKEIAARYASLAKSIAADTYRLCWNASKGLLADTYDKKSYSQHANILGVLTDAIPVNGQKALIERIIADTSITQATYYFQFYLFEALKKVHLGDEFPGLLEPWKKMLNLGLTTFAEKPEPTRSDCHAWSASPIYEFLSILCGVKSAAPGFEKVIIEPCTGGLAFIEGKIPHPKGIISVSYKRTGKGLHAVIDLPEGLSGNLVREGKSLLLKPGKQELDL